jgi:putative heme-binding domain-containing protein
MKSATLSLIVCLCLVPAAAAQDKKAALLKDVKAPKGYDVSVFAAPPEVNYPTCLTCGAAGELFVGVDLNGSLDAKPDRGKIFRLVDTKGTGTADKITLFAKVDSPRGLVYANKTLFVLHPPNLTAFYDDGDGPAKRSEVLVKGIGKDLKFRGADHTTNGIRLGIDGWIYVAVGDYGFTKAVGKDGKELQFRGGGIVRVRPDGTELEVVVRGTRNIYDVAIDPLMNLFTRDNTNDGDGWDVRLNHDTPLGHFGYPSLFVNFKDEILQPLADYGGGAPTGALFMDEPGFPPEVGRTLLTCDWGRNTVYRHPLTAKGATFTIEQASFLQLSRPTGIACDGQGRLYVASWRGASFTYVGPDVGYLVRVTHPGWKAEPLPNWAKASEADLLRHLASPSQTVRLLAQQEILRRGPGKSVQEGLQHLIQAREALGVRVAALFTYCQLVPADTDYLVGLYQDASLREFALRALADRKSRAAALPVDLFAKALSDTDPRVRLQAVIGLARVGKVEAATALLPLTADADPVVAHTAIQSLAAMHATDVCLAELGRPGTTHALACVRVLQNFHEKAVVDGLLERYAAAKESAVRAALFRGLCRLYNREADWDSSWWGTRPNTAGPYYKPVAWQETTRIGAFLKSALAGADEASLRYMLPELVRHRVDLPDLTERLIAAAKADPAFQAKAVELLVIRGKVPREAIVLLEEIARSPKADPVLRAKVVRSLWRGTKAEDGLLAALRSLAEIGDLKKAPQPLADVFREFTTDFGHAKTLPPFLKAAGGADAKQREVAYLVLLNLRGNKNASRALIESVDKVVDAALSNPERAVAMLRAIGTTRSDDYGVRVQGLVKSDRPDVRQAAADAVKLLGLDRPPAERKDIVKSLAFDDVVTRASKEKGDAVLGSRLFLKQNCIACHTVSKDEPVKGPFLGDVTARYKRAELIESILRPSAKIAQGFETHVFTMTDGKIVTGFVVRESGDEVEIRDVSGLSSVLKKKDIDERRQSKESVMPEGLADTLTVHELASILAYLETLNAKKN